MNIILALCFLLNEKMTNDLVKDLGSENFKIRAKAHKKLEEKMNFSLFVKVRKIKSSDLEINRRLELLVAGYKTKIFSNHKIDLKGYPEYPWICQGLPKSYRWKGLKPGQIINKYGEPMWYIHDVSPTYDNYRAATKAWIEDRMNEDFNEALKCKNEKDSNN